MPPSASASATRFAAHWIIDALAGDEALDFFVLKALVGASSEPLAGAPEATRERVALRCLQEVSSVIAAGGDAVAAAGVLRVGGARSCEDVLLRLISSEVGSSGNLEKDLLLPFSQDIQETICTKKPTLPETSFQLLKGVDLRITPMASPSQLEHNGTDQCDNHQSCSSHEHVNIEKPMFPTDKAEVQRETTADLVIQSETGNLQKDPSAPTSVLHQPCTPNNRSYVPPQEDTIDEVGLGAGSPEKSPIMEGNMSVGSVLASAGCDAPLQGSMTEPFSQQHAEDHIAAVDPQSCRQKSPSLPHCVDGEEPDDGGSSNQSSRFCIDEGPSVHVTVTPGFDRIIDVLPTDASEPGHLPECITTQGTAMISEPRSSKAHLSALQHERGEKVNQDIEDVCASIRPVEKDNVHGELTLQGTNVLLSVSCNGAIQGSETNLQPGNATEDMMVSEERSADKSHLKVTGANKANHALLDDSSTLKNNTVHGGLTAHTAPVSQNCNVTLHDKTSGANCISEQKNENNRAGVQKDNWRTSIPSSSRDGDGESAKKASNEEKFGYIYPEICVHLKDQDINDTLEGLSQQDLCIKCGKDGQLLKCSGCLLAAHDFCFGSSVTFEETDLFYCPVCFYKKTTEAYQKAKKTYCEARKNLAAFLGTTQVVMQHDEQLNGVQPGAAKRDGHSNGSDSSKRNSVHQNEASEQLNEVQPRAANIDDRSNGCDMSKRKGILQNETDNLAHQGEEHHQQRKKQKINTRGNGHSKEVLAEKVSFQNPGLASTNKDSMLLNNSHTRIKDPEKKQQAGDKEAGNDNSSHETRASSQRRCDPPANQDTEADQEDGLTVSNQSGGSDDIEATSSNDIDKRSSPPWRDMGHNKARLQEKESAVSSKSKKAIGKQDQHMRTSPRKGNSAHPQKRYSNPVAPTGRRTKLCWTEEEEAILREAMSKFTPQDGAPIPWIRVLEYGSSVFHRTRLPSDLRVKWRNMKKKSGGY